MKTWTYGVVLRITRNELNDLMHQPVQSREDKKAFWSKANRPLVAIP